MIKKETIQNIIDASKIEEVVGDFVSLKKRGVNYIGLCPFHNEKTPSFTVSPAKGFYHCFGCGKGGGPVDFVMEHEHLTYPDALKYLAGKYHIEVEEHEQTIEEKQYQSEVESLFQLTAFAQRHFTNNLFSTELGMAIGLPYFTERGFNREIIKKFQLGFSPDKWDDFSKTAIDGGYPIDYLLKTGLTIKKEDGGYYDRFRDRVIFPIHNLSGRVVGFTGRILTSDKSKPKYVNSPESEIYSKGKTLYGIFFAKNAIVATDNCFLVEGNTDVVSLFQAGIENVVASSGTALTTDQIKLIKKFTNNITILYDGDEAGIKASLRGIDMILEEGMNVKIVLFPEGDDPDSYTRKHDTAGIKEYISQNAANFILFKTKLLFDEVKNDPIKRAELIKEIVRTIALIPEPIHRSVYIKECSEILQISEQSLLSELNRLLRKKIKKDVSAPAEDVTDDIVDENIAPRQFEAGDPFDSGLQEKYLLWIMLNYGEIELEIEVPVPDFPDKKEIQSIPVYKYIADVLSKEEFVFSERICQRVYDEYNQWFLEPTDVTLQKFLINHADKELSSFIIELLNQRYYLSKHWEEKYKIYTPRHEDDDRNILVLDISNTINAIQLKRVSKEMHLLEIEIKNMPQETSYEDMAILMDRFMQKRKLKTIIGSRLGSVIR